MYLHLTDHQPFPVITNDVGMRTELADKTEIRFMEQPNGTTVCSYIVSAEGTFDDVYAREARGVVFDARGNVIARPLHKFFNVNERPETHVDKIDWTKVIRVMDKRDGSMIHTVARRNDDDLWPHGWEFDLKSKKSFTSDVAHSAKAFMMLAAEAGLRFHELCNHVVSQGQTAIFEWTSPVARIVLAYPKDELRLLHVRDNTTGEYLTRGALEVLAAKFDIPVVAHADEIMDMIATDPKMLLDLAQTLEGVEGWVIQFSNGDMVKLKTKWYCERHRAMTFLRERDIALLTLREELDDLKALLVGEGADITEILEIEAKTVAAVDEIIASVTRYHQEAKARHGDDRKAIALAYGPAGLNFDHFGLLMQVYSGKDPDYKGYFERNLLSTTFSLRQLNLGQSSIAEVE